MMVALSCPRLGEAAVSSCDNPLCRPLTAIVICPVDLTHRRRKRKAVALSPRSLALPATASKSPPGPAFALLAFVVRLPCQIHSCRKAALALAGGNTQAECKSIVRGMLGAVRPLGHSS